MNGGQDCKVNDGSRSATKILNSNSGNLLFKQEDYKLVDLGKNWESLISKHKLRYDIWMFLNLYGELNVSQISKKVKQNKSTVSRVLIGMQNDGILDSRRGIIKKGERERIAPKYYCINEKYSKSGFQEKQFMKIPSDPEELHDFLLSEIRNHRNAIYNVIRLVNYLSSALNLIDDKLKLGNIENAKELYSSKLSGINEPEFNFIILDKHRFKNFYDLRLEYTLKLKYLLLEKEVDANSAFVYFDSLLPLKDILDLNKEANL